jgi:UDP-N-acetylmuramoyl-L-alanyl-D-glutamate--2,6-diaminopimelate ligase
MKLSEILPGTATKAVHGPLEREIRALQYDSRQVGADDVFFAWKGDKTDGHGYIPEVCRQGAAAVVLEEAHAYDEPGPTFIEVASARRAMATMAANYFGRPDRALRLAGITGTNGKTTTAFILKHLLAEADAPVGLIGTVRYEIGDEIVAASRTTPESLDLHALLARMKKAGCRSVVMEVSSHALEQGRVAPIEFEVGVFTNLTRDHLDYHRTMEAYAAAKRLLFTNLDRPENPGVAVINADDAFGRDLIHALAGRVRVISYSVTNESGADLRADRLQFSAQETRGRLRLGDETFELSLPLLGAYNVANALAAAGAALAFGVAPATIIERLRDTPQVPGRLEKFTTADGVTVVVDYAHTDDAVRKALEVLRGITTGRLAVVLGCGGNRDAAKRPLMARAAVEGADHAFFTADNPRRENLGTILDQMEAGLDLPREAEKFTRVPDRREAIAQAIAWARPGDIVCVAGKGHETTQEIAGEFFPCDDRVIVRELLAGRAA